MQAAHAQQPPPRTAEVIIPIQPRPRVTSIIHGVAADGRPYTAIARVWAEDGSACRLCPACSAACGLCHVRVNGRHVSEQDAPLYSLRDAPVGVADVG